MEGQSNRENPFSDKNEATPPTSPTPSELSGMTASSSTPPGSGLSGTTAASNQHNNGMVINPAPTLLPLPVSPRPLDVPLRDNHRTVHAQDVDGVPRVPDVPAAEEPPASRRWTSDHLPHQYQNVIDAMENEKPPSEGYPADNPLRGLSGSWGDDTLSALGIDVDIRSKDSGVTPSTRSPGTSDRRTGIISRPRPTRRFWGRSRSVTPSSASEERKLLPKPRGRSEPSANSSRFLSLRSIRSLGRDIARTAIQGAANHPQLPIEAPRNPRRDLLTIISPSTPPLDENMRRPSNVNHAVASPVSPVSPGSLGLHTRPFQSREVARTVVQGARNPFEEYRDPTRDYRVVSPSIPTADGKRRAVVVDGLLNFDGTIEEVDLNDHYSLFDEQWNLNDQAPSQNTNGYIPLAESNEAGPSSRRRSRRQSVKDKMNKIKLVVRRASNALSDLSTRRDPKGKGRRSV